MLFVFEDYLRILFMTEAEARRAHTGYQPYAVHAEEVEEPVPVRGGRGGRGRGRGRGRARK